MNHITEKINVINILELQEILWEVDDRENNILGAEDISQALMKSKIRNNKVSKVSFEKTPRVY